MDIHEDPEIGTTEKVTRIGCGALLGFVFGFYMIVKYSVESFGGAAALVVAATCVCGYLALKYGDEFWYRIVGRDE